MPRLCAVCSTNPHKYRCPKCRTVYCSVKCFKDHACAPVASPADNGSPAARSCDGPSGGGGATREPRDDQFVPGALVRPEHIARLRADAKTMNYLSDSRLQAVMRDIDGARNREKALTQALETNPAFKQVMDTLMETGGWGLE